MAEIFPNEGLAFIQGIYPKDRSGYAASDSASVIFKLFTSQTATTTISAAQALSDITEATFTGYAAAVLQAATWGASTVSAGLGVKTTYGSAVSMTSTSTQTINGFYLVNPASSLAIAQANFDDGAAVALNSGDVIQVTPAIIFGN